MKIVELKIDELDELTGFDAVALVNQPAIEAEFRAFNSEDVDDAIAFQVIKSAVKEQFVTKLPGESRDSYLQRCIPTLIKEGYDQDQATAICYDTFSFEEEDKKKDSVLEEFNHFDDLPSNTQEKLLQRLGEIGISYKDLAEDGYKIIDEEEFNKEQFALPTRSSADPDGYTNDTSGNYKILYQYTVKAGKGSPIQENTRDFCRRLIDLNLLFRHEDINRMTVMGANSEEFGVYDIFNYKGSYNCRHYWKKVYVYQKKSPGLLEVAGLLLDQAAKNIEDAGGGPGNVQTNTTIAFKKHEFAAVEDQQIVVGPLMIPDKLIFRVDENNEPYYVYFSKETVKMIAEKMMRDKLLDRMNIEHDPDSPVEGYMMETWIVEDELKDKQQVYGFNFPVGTWMGQYKIKAKDTWSKVKDGTLKAFSIEGFFADRLVQN